MCAITASGHLPGSREGQAQPHGTSGYGFPGGKATVRGPPGAARYDGGFCIGPARRTSGVRGSPPGQALRHCRYADYRACRRRRRRALLRGLRAAAPDTQITVIGNTADESPVWPARLPRPRHGDVYARRWHQRASGVGRAAETFAIRDELAAYGAGPSWFTLGDRDFATQSYAANARGGHTAVGGDPGAVLAVAARRGADPMSDDRVETHVTIKSDAADGGSPPGDNSTVPCSRRTARLRRIR